MNIHIFTVVTGISDLDTLIAFEHPQDGIDRFMEHLNTYYPEQYTLDDYKHVLFKKSAPQMYERTDDETIELQTVRLW
jgi:hypothetical protein